MCKGVSAEKEHEEAASANESFRDYSQSKVVERHYRDMRTNQTVEFVKMMHARYSFADEGCRARMSIREAFDKLESYVDSSDPDLSLPNLVHMLQTAEGIRKAGLPDWFQLVGLIHDMGKVMFLWGDESIGQLGTAEASQWALGGDTWPVGCRLPEAEVPGVVFPEFSKLNPDMANPMYNTKYGIYEPNCGLDNLMFAYGHDEYLYQVLVANKCPIPKAGLDMVRYHSAYPWHTGRQFDHFMTEQDFETLKNVKHFNQYDLYTKDQTNNIDPTELWPHYQALIDKYCPSTLRW